MIGARSTVCAEILAVFGGRLVVCTSALAVVGEHSEVAAPCPGAPLGVLLAGVPASDVLVHLGKVDAFCCFGL